MAPQTKNPTEDGATSGGGKPQAMIDAMPDR